jgi:alkanesulfonate monooxygenase SsuD/methylene tetrahydromethanopterin reductase-like flavin-dependent oxidoreductase (luciferase family)
MLTAMLISLGLPTDRLPKYPALATADTIQSVSQRAEAAGYDAVFVTDHPFPSAKYIARGGHHSLDPFVSLGYLEPEFAALGAEFAARGARNDEVLRAMYAAWGGAPVEMSGSDFSATDNVMQPLPLQQPHPPVLIGGNSVAAIRRAVTMAQGWIPMPSPASASKMLGTPGIESLGDLEARIAISRRLAEEHGRTEPLEIWFTPWALSGFGDKQWDPTPLRDELAALEDLGVSGVTITLPGTTVDEFNAALDRFAEDVVKS